MVTAGGTPTWFTVIVNVAEATCPGLLESATVTVIVTLWKGCVGVSEITPFGLSVRPKGSVPLVRENVYGVLPPEA